MMSPTRPPRFGAAQQKVHEAAARRRYESTPDRKADKAFYNSALWKQFRLLVLAEHPCCQDCEEMSPPRVTPATQVDHVVDRKDAPERAFDRSNARALCLPCHSAKTMRTWRRKGGGQR